MNKHKKLSFCFFFHFVPTKHSWAHATKTMQREKEMDYSLLFIYSIGILDFQNSTTMLLSIFSENYSPEALYKQVSTSQNEEEN
jgi:hypothetical protein